MPHDKRGMFGAICLPATTRQHAASGFDFEQTFFVASHLTKFDEATGLGTLQWDRYVRQPGLNFNKVDVGFARAPATEFPGTEYDRDPALPFSISFASPRTLRLRLSTRQLSLAQLSPEQSLMLAAPVPEDHSWRAQSTDSAVTYTSAFGSVRVTRQPWSVEIRDASGRLLTRTQRLGEPASFTPYIPFSFVRRTRELARHVAATFELAPDEGIYGFGESFTRLNKRGQRIVAFIRDAMGAQSKLQ